MKQFTVIFTALLLILSCNIGLSEGNENEKVRLGYLQNDLHQLACWVAMDKGYFKKEGLEIESSTFQAGPEEMSAFAGGCLDIGYVGEAPATAAVANGTAGVVVLAQVNKDGSAVMVRKDSNIKEVVDLIGKTVAVPGHAQVQDFLLRKALAAHGVRAEDLRIIVLKPPEMIGALKTSQIDAFIAWEPYPAKTVTLDVGKVLVNSSEIWNDHPCCVLVADSTFLKQNPDKIRGIVKAHVKATNFINENLEEAVKIGMRYTGMDENTVRLAMKNIKYDYIPSIEGEIEYVTFLSKLNYVKVNNPREFTDKFIQTEVLKEIKNK